MSDSINIVFDSKDIAILNNTLKRAESETRRKMPNLIQQATIWTVQSAKKITPISKKKRARTPKNNAFGVKNPEGYESGVARKGKYYKYKIWHYKGDNKKGIPAGKLSYWRTNKASSKRRIIGYRGAAKAGWIGVLRKMGKGRSRPEGGRLLRRIMHKASGFKKGGGELKPFTEFENKIKYIGKVAPYSLRIALMNTGERLMKQMERDIEKMGFND